MADLTQVVVRAFDGGSRETACIESGIVDRYRGSLLGGSLPQYEADGVDCDIQLNASAAKRRLMAMIPPARSAELSVRMNAGALIPSEIGPFAVQSSSSESAYGQPPHFCTSLYDVQMKSLNWVVARERAAEAMMAQVFHEAVVPVSEGALIVVL